jgi:hypothetical protein
VSAVGRSPKIISDAERLEHLRKREIKDARCSLNRLRAKKIRCSVQHCDPEEIATIL